MEVKEMKLLIDTLPFSEAFSDSENPCDEVPSPGEIIHSGSFTLTQEGLNHVKLAHVSPRIREILGEQEDKSVKAKEKRVMPVYEARDVAESLDLPFEISEETREVIMQTFPMEISPVEASIKNFIKEEALRKEAEVDIVAHLDIESVRDRQTAAIKELFEAVDNLGKEAEFDALFDKVNPRK